MLCFFLSDEELEEAVLRPGWKFSQLLQNWHGEETVKSSNTVTSVLKDASRCSQTDTEEEESEKNLCLLQNLLRVSTCRGMRPEYLLMSSTCGQISPNYGLSVHIYGHTPCVCVCVRTYMCVWLSVHTFLCVIMSWVSAAAAEDICLHAIAADCESYRPTRSSI